MSTPGLSRFAAVGLDLGIVGKWLRLAWGISILVFIVLALATELTAGDISPLFLPEPAAYFFGIAGAYRAAYYGLAERVLVKVNPWTNMAIFVGPGN